MTFRAVTHADVAEVEAFLRAHIETSVFLLSNLRRFGPSGAGGAHAMSYWATGTPVSGVIAQSAKGVVLVQWPDVNRATDWALALAVLPSPIAGAIGEGGQINALLTAAGLRDRPTNLDADETLFALDLADLRPQDGLGTLRPLRDADRPVVVPWRTDYAVHVLGEPEATGPARALREIDAYIKADSHRLLEHGGEALSMTGFNADVDGLVQIGGVYTPPEKRGRGHARRAVALHLEEARLAGKTRAILFANDPAAIAAYRAVGFRPIGRFALVMFCESHVAQ